MKLHGDPRVDALYLRQGDSKIVESEEVRPGVVLDLDVKDRMVGVEIINVKKHFPEADVKPLQVEVASS